MINIWIDSAGAIKEPVYGLRLKILNTQHLARQILFGSLLPKVPDVRVEVLKVILVQYLALCSGCKALDLFARIGRTRSLVELFQLRIACYEQIARQHHQSLAQEMVDFIDAAMTIQSQHRDESRARKNSAKRHELASKT